MSGFPFQAELDELVKVWRDHYGSNRLKHRYYRGRNNLKDLGISIPPPLKDVETVVGWPAKAVDALAVRSRFDGFACEDEQVEGILAGITEESNLSLKYRQAVQSELIYSCSFATVSKGMDGEPSVIISLHSAETAAATWDFRKGRVKTGLTLNDFDKDGHPIEAHLYLEDRVIRMWRDMEWHYEEYPSNVGRPLMEAFAYRPTELRPFGQTRITRAVRSITDSAVREALRTEISAEFATSPQKYLLGGNEDTFKELTKWEAYIGNIFSVTYNGEDDVMPHFGQLPQASMQPHVEYMALLARRFAAETNIPLSTLGVVTDNPASAEAMRTATEPLVIEAEDLNDGNRRTLKAIAQMAVAAQLDTPLDQLTPEQRAIVPTFRDPSKPSMVSQVDSVIKIASVVPEFAGTDVFWEQLGFSEDTRARLQAELEERRSQALIDAAVFGQ